MLQGHSNARAERSDLLMGIAEIYSLRSTCARARVGAVLSREGRVITAGYNGAPAGLPHCLDEGCEIGDSGGCSRAVHAEANAIAAAAKVGISTADTFCYSTLAPCLPCAQLIINAGVIAVVYRDPHRDTGGLELLKKAGVSIMHYNV